MSDEQRLSKDDLELWNAALAEYQRYMALAQAALVPFERVFAARYALGAADRIAPDGSIVRPEQPADAPDEVTA